MLFGFSNDVVVILLFIAVVMFLFWRWVFKFWKKPVAKKIRLLAIACVTVISTPLVYVAIFICWILVISYHPHREFNRDSWLADPEHRYELSDDIIKREMLIGKTQDEVRQILGDPDQSDENDQWIYVVGFKPGIMPIDPDIIEIEFKEGKVIRVSQRQT